MSRPSRRDWSTIVATSSSVNVDAASAFGCTPNSRTTPFAAAFSVRITGYSTFDSHTRGVARSSTARSGSENARFFGTISPKTTCRNDTITSVMMNAIASTAPSASPRAPSGTASRWCIAGSDTFRISSEHTVMPSCEVASIRVACSIAYSAVRAERDPRSASGSICERRAEITANSAPTKNAFAASSTISQKMPAQSFIGSPPRRSRRPAAGSA